MRRLLDAGAVDLVNVDASECGGVTEWRRAAALGQAAGVRMAHHEESQVAQHLLAGVPHGTYVECFADPERDPVWQTMWANRPVPKGWWCGDVALTIDSASQLSGPAGMQELTSDLVTQGTAARTT